MALNGNAPCVVSALANGQEPAESGCNPALFDMPGFDIYVATSGMTRSQRLQLSEALRRNWTGLLPGLAMPEQPRKQWLTIKLAASDKFSPKDWKHAIAPDTGATMRIDVRRYGAREAFDAAACRRALHSIGGDEDVCEYIGAALVGLAANTPRVWHLAEEGEGCSPNCVFTARLQHGSVRGYYSVDMQNYVPSARTIYVGNTTVVITPLGQFEGLIHRKFTEVATRGALVQEHEVSFDKDWQLLAENIETRGERGALARAIDHLINEEQHASRSKRTDQVKVVIIDTAIDMSDVRLHGKLDFDLEALREFQRDGSFVHSPLSYTRDPLSHMREVVDDTYHGTTIAGLIAGGNDAVRIGLLRTGEFDETDALREKWIDHIRASGARVVNIAATFSHVGVQCRRFFGGLFSRLDDVLFIISMGNAGAQEPFTTCPVEIAFEHPNVLAVAGTDESGKRIHPSSNRGRSSAHVAAPFNALCLAPHGEIATCAGTSVSSALVTNAAVRIIAKDPRISTEGVVNALMASCRDDGLDVACGGEISRPTSEGQ